MKYRSKRLQSKYLIVQSVRVYIEPRHMYTMRFSLQFTHMHYKNAKKKKIEDVIIYNIL